MTAERTELAVNGWNADYIEQLYQQWLEQPDSVEAKWRPFFQGFDLGARQPASETELEHVAHTRQGRVDSLIYHYRDIGHVAADLDPLGTERAFPDSLTLESFSLNDDNLDEGFDPGHLPMDNPSSLREIIKVLSETYCRHVGVEYMHIQDRAQRRWLQERMEPTRNRPDLPREQRLRILDELIEGDALESFLALRYTGKKWFSLEGGLSLNPMMREIIEMGPGLGVGEFTIGMAHRGRINVLVNVLQKSYAQLFTEFEESWTEDFIEGGGDVKYHKGYSSDYATVGGEKVRLTLSPNPSHLEFGHSVVLGRARAKQRIRKDAAREQCVPILIHGDASFPGQGIVAEMFNMAHLDGYTVGGAVHIVVNNQIGFTTNPRDAHSGKYCTDIAKMIGAPIFHVNGDDPEACVFVATLAMLYRQTFKNDVVIDLWCYRKYGHNEGDEPAFTQPLMYDRIKQQVPVFAKYSKRLVEEGVISQDEVDRLYDAMKARLDETQTQVKEEPVDTTVQAFRNVWSGLTEKYSEKPVETAVSREGLSRVARSLGSVPDDFHLHRKLKKLMDYRRTAVDESQPLDWGMGEMLAYGTLLADGHAVRLTGQDVERGTFSHRHAVLFDQEDGHAYEPLNHISSDQAKYCVHNSPLTESACVGFEYGYSLGDPNQLIIWEAQFGDFVNGAQVIIDQFIASAEIKWKRFSGLTMFLPHGYEGQGPEHSSARLERFLTLCAGNNMQVAYPTTPAQMFHLLRRQMKRRFRKPLIIMTPKSLLRHRDAVSDVSDLTSGHFQHLIDDHQVDDPADVRRLIFCSGKVYYDLMNYRKEEGIGKDSALVRMEQLYPVYGKPIRAILKRYAKAKDLVWVQEEPKNMGAWTFMDGAFRELFDVELRYVGRDRNASPAVASNKMHQQEQERLLVNALGIRGLDEIEHETTRKLAKAG